jgi:hypothetical protein
MAPAAPAGSHTLVATFVAAAGHGPSNVSVAFAVSAEETSLTYTGPHVLANGQPATLSGKLAEDGTAPIVGRTVTFALGGAATVQSCSAATDAGGVATCTIPSVVQPGTSAPVQAVFAGDTFYRPASASGMALLQHMTGRAFGLSLNGLLLIPATPDTGPIVTSTASMTSPACLIATNLPAILPLVSAHGLCASVATTVNPDKVSSNASVSSVQVGLLGLPVIKGGLIQSNSTTTCAAAVGSTTIGSLQMGGTTVVPAPTAVAPNTTVNVGLVKIIMNEQLAVIGDDRGLTVNAVHITVPGALDLILASSSSGMRGCIGLGTVPARGVPK